MTSPVSRGASPSGPARPFLPVLLLLFVGSGCAALVYEIVWFQMLQLVIGASGISLGVLLGTFMGGMFLGSLALPRFVTMARHPLRVYAALEAGIGLLGLVLLIVIPLVSGVYSSVVPHGMASVLVRAALCGLLLLPPTVLMGATLPAISRYVETTPRGVAWMGFFYGGNIAGAVVGCLLAGYYLLRVFDIPTATAVAVGINAVVAAAAYGVSRVSPGPTRADDEAPDKGTIFMAGHADVYVVIGLSGLTALGAEVVWTRLMSLLLGATTYTFSVILAVFLAALGIGSAVGSHLSRTLADPRKALALCQALVVAAVAWTAHLLSAALPFWPINPSITTSPWYLFQIDVVRTVLALLPAPLLWGASFPLAVAAASRTKQDPGRLMAGVYAANTVGAIVGALAFSLLAMPWLGSRNAQRVLMVMAAVAATVLLAPALVRRKATAAQREGVRDVARSDATRARSWALALVGLVAVCLLVWRVGPVPPVLVAYGRYAPTYDPPRALYVGEGVNSSIAVTELANGDRNLHVGGKVVASTEPQDMRLQRLLGHMTALLAQEPHSVLVVGFGAGVTAGTFVTHPSVERIVIVEIEPLVTDVASEWFAGVNHDVLNDSRVELIHDDARHYLLTSDETFDLITADPIHPWMKGAASLYTEEYFELARRRLNPGGVVTQWVPLYESTEDVVKSEMATFFQVFPEGVVWGNTNNGQGYDVVLAASDGPLHIDVDALAARLDRPDHDAVAASLRDVGYQSATDLLATYAGRARDLREWLRGAEINRDSNLRLMFLAGLRLNRYEQADIYNDILARWSFPTDVFTGSEERLQRLRSAFGM